MMTTHKHNAPSTDDTTPIDVEIAIIGAGSAGERMATLLGPERDVALIERRLVGGECPFFACIPSKAMLIRAAERAGIADVERNGVVAPDAADDLLDRGTEAFAIAAEQRDEAAAQHDDTAHVQSVLEAGVQLVHGEARIVSAGRLSVQTDDGPVTVTYDDLVIATGSAPVIPDIPGLAEASPWTFEDAWTTLSRPLSMLIMGAGAVGCEIAQTFARFGTAVTLVDAAPVLGGGEEPEIGEDLAHMLGRDGVDVRQHAEVSSVTTDQSGLVRVTVDDEVLEVEQLVCAVGMAPRLDSLGLDLLGIDTDDLTVDDHLRVNGQSQVWAIGDVTGIAPFTHTANYHARVVSTNLAGGSQSVSHKAIPRAVYTKPEMAGVGLTRAQAEEAGHTVASTVFDLADTARGAVDISPGGRLVLVADAVTRCLLGASMVSPTAGESISEWSLAINEGITVDAMANVIHPFPTWSEGFGPAIAALLDELD